MLHGQGLNPGSLALKVSVPYLMSHGAIARESNKCKQDRERQIKVSAHEYDSDRLLREVNGSILISALRKETDGIG